MIDIMNCSKYDKLKIHTKNISLIWKQARGIAPDSTADKMDEAMLHWMAELTDTLSIWIEKGSDMTDGELILARTNMGALAESWLKFFYCVYYDDYIKNPKVVRNKVVEPNKITFSGLIEFSVGILCDDKQDSFYLWTNKIREYRNAIHAFNYKDIGTPIDFIGDMDELYEFVKQISDRLPPLEDCIECYPAGYIPVCL